jgi:uncharacterized cupredoxin-like copper-binding protein
MRFSPADLTVAVGETVAFEVANTGQAEHELVIGDEAVQAEHELEMAGEEGHGEESSYAVSVPPGETRVLVYRFDEPGELLYGCHEPGHYAAGMKGTITVVEA